MGEPTRCSRRKYWPPLASQGSLIILCSLLASLQLLRLYRSYYCRTVYYSSPHLLVAWYCLPLPNKRKLVYGQRASGSSGYSAPSGGIPLDKRFRHLSADALGVFMLHGWDNPTTLDTMYALHLAHRSVPLCHRRICS